MAAASDRQVVHIARHTRHYPFLSLPADCLDVRPQGTSAIRVGMVVLITLVFDKHQRHCPYLFQTTEARVRTFVETAVSALSGPARASKVSKLVREKSIRTASSISHASRC